MASYANEDVLVSTEWVAEVAANPEAHPNVRIVESDEDRALYTQGHVPGAVEIDWQVDLQDARWRDYIDRAAFEDLCRRKGISNDTTVVFYGDKSNWWACYAFWTFKLYGHADCRLMNGGRKKWALEGRPWSTDRVEPAPGTYTATEQDMSIRALRDEVLQHQEARKPLIDVRSPEEYTGARLHMPDYPNEGSLRGGHIPGAISIPWPLSVNEDGTFKSADELEQLYLADTQLSRDADTVAYCRIGERSSLTWLVLKYLLGFTSVKNYDGSWLEWGNAVRMPIVQGPTPDGSPSADSPSA